MSAPPPIFPPGLLERYEPVRGLGRGGMGAVFLARDRTLDREVAVKVMLPASTVEHRKRFEREAACLARVEHSGVVRVYDFGLVDDTPYLVMEVLAGDSLDHGHPQDRLAALARDAAGALDAVHGAGLIHRDVKPANLFLCEDGRLVLVDFGLTSDPGQTRLTATGAVCGTLGFLPPEALAGAEPSPAWDWWALGVSLYRLAEGELPFSFALLQGVAVGRGLPPVRFQELQDRRLQRVILGLLDPEPVTRLGSAGAVKAALPSKNPDRPPDPGDRLGRAGVAADGGTASTASTGRFQGWIRGAALAMLAAGVAGGLWFRRVEEPSAPPPVAPSWRYPFPGDLADRVRAELRDAEGYYVGPHLEIAPLAGGADWRPLLDPDPRHGWAVVRRLPSVLAALEWLRDADVEELAPELVERFAAVDELMEGQLLWPPFRAARQGPPAGEPATWIAQATRLLDRAAAVVEDRRATYLTMQSGAEPPPDFPEVVVPHQRLYVFPFRELLRRGFYTPRGRHAMGVWLAPAPQLVEDAIWALGRAADGGQEVEALRLALRRLPGLADYASVHTMVMPPDLLLGRRARTPEGHLLEVVAGRVVAARRARADVPNRVDEEVTTLEALRRELPAQDWRSQLALVLVGRSLARADRRAEAMARTGGAMTDLLRVELPLWLALEVVSVYGEILEDPEAEVHWGDELAALLDRRLAALAPRSDDIVPNIQGVLADSFPRRRARDTGFTYVGSFE